ncbi:type II toxin-antitoxin system VapC family toxin [Aquincola tertiaricarbonis]|nr:type II toxin-antitoxin system VapC family toxin [Aquincola tertiaricarbonis]
MRLLLDTQLLLWTLSGDKRMKKLTPRLLDEENECFFSVASLWEIAIKHAIGKLQADAQEVRDECLSSGFKEIQITFAHVRQLVGLPHVHRDPFDRLLVAQAMGEPLRLLTADNVLGAYGPHVEFVAL